MPLPVERPLQPLDVELPHPGSRARTSSSGTPAAVIRSSTMRGSVRPAKS